MRALSEQLIPAGDAAIAFPATGIELPRSYKQHYPIRGKYINQWSTAVREDHGIEFAMLPPLPQIALPGLELIEQKAKWQVDVTVRGHEIPCTTALPDRTLLAAGESTQSTRVRSGRSGISFESHNSFFVPASPAMEQMLRRPHLRYPSLLKWAEARSSVHGMTVKLSTAGAHAQILAKMLGGRAPLTELMSGPLLPALHAFNRKGSTLQAFPNDKGCVVRESYLNFPGMCSIAGIDQDEAARDTIDGLLGAGLLHRGLLVICPAWDPFADQWEEGFSQLLHYVERNGDARVPHSHTVDGFKLGYWVLGQRQKYAKGTLSADRQRRLRRLSGWTWRGR